MDENNQTKPISNDSGKMKNLNFIFVAIIVVVAALVIPNMIKANKNSEMQKQAEMVAEITPSTEPTTTIAPEVVDVENGEISIEAGSFYYKPNMIRIKKGEKVKLTLDSVSMMHDFVVDELGIKVPVTKSGESITVEITANKVGEFEYYCSVGQHRQNGQVGKLIVVE